MWSMPVVVMKPALQRVGSLLGVGVGAGVGPFAQAGLHQPLSLAIGAWGVWARAQVTHAQPTDQASEATRSVAGAVVGQDALKLHAQAPVVAHCPQQRPARTATALVRLDGAERHAGVVIDGQMDVFPADAIGVDLAIAGDPMSRLSETRELLDVQMQQLAGQGVFVAVLRRSRLQFGQAVQAGATQQPGDGARGHRQVPGDLPIRLSCAAPLDDVLHNLLWRGMRAGTWPRGPVDQALRTFFLEPSEPLIGRADADTGRMRCFLDAKALNKDAVHEQGSTARAQTGMFMQVHPGLLGAGLASQPPSSRDAPDEQPTERSQLAVATVFALH
ncbi:hypothetical protein XVE_5076 [Xanthomonas vesicatoria ATCC 35937]|uniref:Uncharacterized protein n=1 Tax=Xanthomonas vesicatoria ATCC 35937 TaxID=925775 RepID=F0BLA2_9XANT|nr:hypothetical protein XVE_5076 [Xanthomonas vesicatoria ATCC 35937]